MAHNLRIAILSLWLGAMSLFSFIVAPAAFAVLPEQRLAGNVVSRVLSGLEIIGIAIGVILLLILLFYQERKGKFFVFELAAVGLMTISMIVSRFIVSRQLHDLRVKYQDQLSTLASSDPIRMNFNELHQYSVWLMGFNILTALVLIVLLVRRTYPQTHARDNA